MSARARLVSAAPTAAPAAAHTALRVVSYELRNAVRSRWLLGYALFYVLATDALLRFGDDGAKALLSLMSVVLFVLPLVAVVFGTMYLYDAREFTELLLAQPVGRKALFAGLYVGLAAPLSLAFVAGVALPFAWHGLADPAQRATLATLLGAGVALTCVFTAVAFLIALRSDDKVKGLGVAVGIWLLFSLLYDGLVLLLAMVFADYPLERPLLALMLANPVDLARVALLLRLDVSALMGYTGAVFQQFFGGAVGATVAAAALALWVAVPVALGVRAFERKDF
jgi:Cu-processing system permease protein